MYQNRIIIYYNSICGQLLHTLNLWLMKMLAAFLLIPEIVGPFRHLHTDSWTIDVTKFRQLNQSKMKNEEITLKSLFINYQGMYTQLSIIRLQPATIESLLYLSTRFRRTTKRTESNGNVERTGNFSMDQISFNINISCSLINEIDTFLR